MAKIIFYRQKRRDDGIHTGIEIDGYTAMEQEEGIDWDNADPILVWYVELRCEGKKLPGKAEEARKWLLEQGRFIRESLVSLASELQVGMDYNNWPLLWTVPNAPRGVRMSVACHAMHRADALAIAEVISDVALHWQERIEKLSVPE